MRTQGWWLTVSLRDEKRTKWEEQHDSGYKFYCSIWLGDNRVGTDEKQKAQNIAFTFRQTSIGHRYHFSLTEQWLSGTEHKI